MQKIVSIRCGWPDYVTRKTTKRKFATQSRLKGDREIDYRPGIVKSDKPWGGIRFQNKLEKAREEISARRKAIPIARRFAN